MQIFLSNNLKVLRRGKRVSQEELARILSVSRNKISSYEGKGTEPKLSLLLRISEFFEISVDDLVTAQITEDTITQYRQRYLSIQNGSMNSNTGVADHVQPVIDSELVRQFVENNKRSFKMLDGFKSFNRLKSRNEEENHEVNNLIIILDHVLSVNKTFVHDLKHQILNA